MSERCRICGEDNSVVLEQHHKVPRRYGGGDRPENLVTLCANCHTAIETIYDDEFFEQTNYTTPSGNTHVSLETAGRLVEEFVDDCDAVGSGSGIVVKRALYAEFVDWADRRDEPAPPHNKFGRVLNQLDGVESTQRRVNGDIREVYAGLHLDR